MKKTLEPLMTSDKQDWGTPKTLIKFIENELLGGIPFDIDLAASARNKVCKHYINAKQNYLRNSLETSLLAYLNPPYDQVEQFVDKLISDKVPAVMLVPARTDTAWFYKAAQNAQHIRFIVGRLKFKGAPAGAPFPSALFFFNGYQDTPGNPYRLNYFGALIQKIGWIKLTPKERGF